MRVLTKEGPRAGRGGGGEPGRLLTTEELRRRLLALILAAVLLWYTAVTPPVGVAPRVRREGGDEGLGGESGQHDSQARSPGGRAEPEEELDWPEYIGLD